MLNRKTTELPIGSIFANPEQPRKYFAEEELNDLKNSIAEYGVLQPILVKKDGNGKYFLLPESAVFALRNWRASQKYLQLSKSSMRKIRP